MDGDIDKVMSGLDRIIEAAPSYEKLFMRWQRQQWSTEDFDFTEDAKQWADPDLITEEERRFMLFGFSQFFLGEERVTVELLPFAMARAEPRGAGVPDDPDLGRGQAHGLLRPLLPRGLRDEGRRHRRDARHAAQHRQRGLGGALRRHPPRVRRATCARTRRDFAAARPRHHRLHGRDRGDARPDRRPVHDPQRSRSATGSRASRPASPPSTATSRATSASASSSSPTRSRTTRRTRRSSRRR